MFSPADTHVVICDSQRLLGPVATICVADCAPVIVKAPKEGHQDALLLQACLRDPAKAAKPRVWPEAALLPIDPELQLAVPTTAYHWVQALQDRPPLCPFRL